jgi:transglutaminase-like putative cysteine protease
MKKLNIAGENLEALGHLSNDAKRPLRVGAIALVLTTLFAAYTGYEFVYIFSNNKYCSYLGGFIWAAVIFAFDYTIYITPQPSLLLKVFRACFGCSSNIIGATLVIISINAAEINNQLLLKDVNIISAIDSTYNGEKDLRYDTYNASIAEEQRYHEQLCVAESHRNGTGPIYDRLHANCLALQAARIPVKAQLDSNEVPFVRTYQLSRAAHSSLKHNDYFSNLNVAINIVKADYSKIALSVLLLLIALIIEFFPLAVNVSKDKSHVYYKACAKLQEGEEKAVLESISEAEKQKNLRRQTAYNSNLFVAQVEHNRFREQLLLYALMDETKAQVDESFGDTSSATLHRLNAKQYRDLANSGNTQCTSVVNIDIFHCTVPMIKVIDEIRNKSVNTEELITNVYAWCYENIKYPKEPRLESCFDAKTCFNARTGVCSESAILIIAFCRHLALEAHFYEVVVDMTGDTNPKHAVAGVINEKGVLQLVDVAMHSCNAPHKEIRLIADVELNELFKIWNR